MRNWLLFMILLMPVVNCFAQKTDQYAIEINAQPDMGKKFSISIRRNKTIVKLLITKVDSIQQNLIKKDPEYINLLRQFGSIKGFDSRDSTTLKLMRDLEYYRQQYTVFKKDSIILTKRNNKAYFKLLDSIVLVPTDSLTQPEKAKKTIFIHPTTVHFIFKGNSILNRDFYVTQPTDKYQPALLRLITNTLDIYRAARPNSFMDKKSTRGY